YPGVVMAWLVEQALQPASPFGDVSVDLPEPPERGGESERVVDGVCRLEPGERSPQVRMLRFEPAKPGAHARTTHLGVAQTGNIHEVCGVPLADGGVLVCSLQQLEGEFASGLEHLVAAVAHANQTHRGESGKS